MSDLFHLGKAGTSRRSFGNTDGTYLPDRHHACRHAIQINCILYSNKIIVVSKSMQWQQQPGEPEPRPCSVFGSSWLGSNLAWHLAEYWFGIVCSLSRVEPYFLHLYDLIFLNVSVLPRMMAGLFFIFPSTPCLASWN